MNIYKNGGLMMDFLKEYLPLLVPIILIELALMFIALKHILTHKNYKIGNRYLWIIITVFVQIIGPILYFIIGKEDD